MRPLERDRGRLLDRCNDYFIGHNFEYFHTINRVVRTIFYSCRVLYIDGASVDRATVKYHKVHARDLRRCRSFVCLLETKYIGIQLG